MKPSNQACNRWLLALVVILSLLALAVCALLPPLLLDVTLVYGAF